MRDDNLAVSLYFSSELFRVVHCRLARVCCFRIELHYASESYKLLSYQVTLSACVLLNLRSSNMFGEVRFGPVEGALKTALRSKDSQQARKLPKC